MKEFIIKKQFAFFLLLVVCSPNFTSCNKEDTPSDSGTTPTIPSVTIGNQVWASKNLDVSTYSDGTPIPQVTSISAWQTLTTGAWCYYNNESIHGTTYGKLYNWYAVAGIHDVHPDTPNKTLAPKGYHIPTDTEWTTLISFLGGESVAGGKMKSIDTSWLSPNVDATNSSSFTGLPGGQRNSIGTFYNIKMDSFWWSATDNVPLAWMRHLHFNNGTATRGVDGKKYGFYVRCLRD